MASVFTRIIAGELPARFVWRDQRCVAFLSINPLRPGHLLVVPRVEADSWLDLDPGEWQHLCEVARRLGAALRDAYRPTKVGLMLAGLEVPHAHVHLVPIDDVTDLDFAGADPSPDPAALDQAASRIREALRSRGAAEVAD